MKPFLYPGAIVAAQTPATLHAATLSVARASRVGAMLKELRGWRDELGFGPLRQAYNAACDRLDVLESCLLAGARR